MSSEPTDRTLLFWDSEIVHYENNVQYRFPPHAMLSFHCPPIGSQKVLLYSSLVGMPNCTHALNSFPNKQNC